MSTAVYQAKCCQIVCMYGRPAIQMHAVDRSIAMVAVAVAVAAARYDTADRGRESSMSDE